MKSFRSIAIVVLLVLAGIVVFQNRSSTTATLLLMKITAPLAVLLAGQLAIGIGIGYLIAWRRAGAKS
jgi:hypothetical protein